MKTRYCPAAGAIALFSIVLLSQCTKEEVLDFKGKVQFGTAIIEEDPGLKSLIDSTNIRTHAVVVTMADRNGELVLDHEALPLYEFGGHWVTKELELPAGSYKLLEFLVVDADGSVKYAAPREDSPKAYLVNDPLPIRVLITKDETTRVSPEVLPVMDAPPEAFGYVTFSFNVVDILAFHIGVYNDNDMILAPTMFLPAKMVVHIDGSDWKHAFRLEPRINRVMVPLRETDYILHIYVEDHPEVVLVKSWKELREATEENPILVPIKPCNCEVIRLKPGPEKGKDATIWRGNPEENGGLHPFFEALGTPPYADADLTSRSLIAFDLNEVPKSATIRSARLRLFYKVPYYWDSVRVSDVDHQYHAALMGVTEEWKEEGVSWKNQPPTTEEGMVYIPCKPWISANHYTVDVTKLIYLQQMDSVQGILFKTLHEDEAVGFRFASSDHEQKELHPELLLLVSYPE